MKLPAAVIFAYGLLIGASGVLEWAGGVAFPGAVKLVLGLALFSTSVGVFQRRPRSLLAAPAATAAAILWFAYRSVIHREPLSGLLVVLGFVLLVVYWTWKDSGTPKTPFSFSSKRSWLHSHRDVH